jgi:hypothetical protein
MTRGIRAAIYKGPYHSPNGGLSSRVDHVTLTGPGVPEVDEPSDAAPEVWLETQRSGHRFASPADGRPADSVGWMASGAYIMGEWSSPWRATFGDGVMIQLHDRSETAAAYASLSR